MTDQTSPPSHRYELTLTLGADSLDDLVYQLHHIADRLELEDRQDDIDITSGSPFGGYHLTVSLDQTVTPESFRAALQAWSRNRRAAKQEAAQ